MGRSYISSSDRVRWDEKPSLATAFGGEDISTSRWGTSTKEREPVDVESVRQSYSAMEKRRKSDAYHEVP